MTLNPQPKPPPREKKPRKRMRRVAAKWSPAFWKAQCERVRAVQDGRCAKCGTGRWFTVAHIKGLKRDVPGGRYNPTHERNQLSNLVGLCNGPGTPCCHAAFDRQSPTTRQIVGAELKKKYEWPPDSSSNP